MAHLIARDLQLIRARPPRSKMRMFYFGGSQTKAKVTNGYPRSRQAFNPPCNGRMRRTPLFLKSSATRALVASFGQVQ